MYLRGSTDTCLCFTGASLELQGYVDANLAGDIDNRKSTTRFVFTLGGTTISWAQIYKRLLLYLLQKFSMLQRLKQERR